MGRLIGKIFKGVIILGVILVTSLWLVLAAPLFSDFRKEIVANVLTEQLGQPVVIEDDVSVFLGAISRIRAGGVRIPSENMADTLLAELTLLELDLDVIKLLRGRFDLDNVTVDGLQVNLIRLENGATSWTSTSPKPKEANVATTSVEKQEISKEVEESENGDILGFLRHRTASFTSIGLLLDDQTSGFAYDFQLDYLTLEQLENGGRLGVSGLGTINGQDLTLDGSYPTGAPFTTKASFGELVLTYDGAPISTDQGGGHTAVLSLDTGSIGDFLDVVGLERVLEGSGHLSVDLASQAELLKIENLEAVVNLDEGQHLMAEGKIDNLLKSEGFDVQFNARFHHEGQPPAAAEELKDLTLTGISTHIVSEGAEIKLDELLLTTNAFEQGLDKVGPVRIGRLYRSPDGKLGMSGLEFQAGPRDAPYILAQGNILDLLQLKQLDLSGRLAAPASLVLGEEVADAFGGVEADFVIDDAKGHLSLTQLEARTVNTDVWHLQAQLALGNVTSLDGVEFDFDLDIADGKNFLGALKLQEIDTGPLEVSASARGKGKEFATRLGLAAGTSRIEASLETAVTDGRPKIDGRIHSERLDIDDLSSAVAGVVELGKIGKGDEESSTAAAGNADETEEPEVQPLVLPKEDPKPTDLVDLEQLFLDTDLTILIEFEEITGQQGVSSVSSELVSREGQASLGPLEIRYGGGYFNIAAEMDLVETPELLSVSGATSGWNFGKILDKVGLGIDAHGMVSGKFDVTGNRSSGKAFINSMYGSASISMSRGDIATSLLELAGLGIFPWLFSDEFRQGYTDIVCVVAPVTINSGKVSFESIVAETESVQLVARGQVDWRNDSIAVRAEPRRVGRPLARSAWPFDVTGKLSDPQFKLDVGGSRSERRDGADEMPADRKPCVPDIYQLE